MDTYEKKYKEALERAKNIHKDAIDIGENIRAKQCEIIFPELKDSEDERIRKLLINGMKNLNPHIETFASIPIKDVIDWLEKQGEKKIDPRYSILDKLIEADDIYQMSVNDAMVEEAKNKAIEVLSKLEISKLLWLEKQGEQGTMKEKKPKKDPCIGCYYAINHKCAIDIKGYCPREKHFDYENANIQQKDFAPQKDIPRYNIGDVLCDKSCTTLNKESQSNFEITDIRNGMYICDKCSFPISQQDEYELVAKRIEQKPADLEEFISELSKQFPDVSFAKLSRIAVRVAKWAKPAWSEEDEKIALSIEQVINCASLLNIVPEKVDKIRTWLKSLKDKCTWKPSEEQLDALKRTQTGVIQFSVLQSLYNDLKNLSQS